MVNFTPSEMEVMQVLWDHGALNPNQIQELFPRPVKNATLRSVLVVLLEKGHVSRRKAGRAYLYEARTPRQNTFQKMVHRISEIFCGGSPTALIAQIIKTEKLSPGDIAELRRLIGKEAEEKNGEPSTGSPLRRKGKKP